MTPSKGAYVLADATVGEIEERIVSLVRAIVA